MFLIARRWAVPLIAFVFLVSGFSHVSPSHAAPLAPGSLIKGESFSAIYYYSTNGKRYVFPDEKAYKTWYNDFSNIVTISDADLGRIMIGGNVTYRPGVKMVKVESAPNVYTVGKGGVLHWINSEAVAAALYGADWSRKVNDLPDVAFANYTVGAAINTASDYNPSAETGSTPTIDIDKGSAVYSPAQSPQLTPPTSGAPTPTTNNQPSQISAVSASAISSEYVMSCRNTFMIKGEITTAGSGIVRYIWVTSEGSRTSERYVGGEQSIAFTGADTKTVVLSWPMEGSFNGSFELHVLGVNALNSNPVFVNQVCADT